MTARRATGGEQGRRRRLVGSIAWRALLACALWLLFTEGSVGGWGLGVPLIILAVFTSVVLRPPSTTRLSIRAAARFLPFFLATSLRGALDVATRAFRGPGAVSPGFYQLEWRLTDGPQRIFLSAVVGLLPGTLGTARTSTFLRVHVLDEHSLDERTLRRLEWHVGRLFDQDLPIDGDGDPSMDSRAARGTPPT